MSPLIHRLRGELAASANPLREAELAARLAANLARFGQFDEARKIVAELRQRHGDARSGPATLWIMVAEALIHLFFDLSPVAYDRIERAQRLGLALGYSSIVAIASAWKAHIELERSDYAAMAKSIVAARAHVGEDDLDTHSRIAIVLCNAYTVLGERKKTQFWFLRGRDHAVKNGDQASIEALLYNRAALGISTLRAQNCIAQVSPSEVASFRSEVKSATNLQDLTRIAALTNHVRLWDARLNILEGRFDEAISALEAVRIGGPFANYNFSQHMIEIELSYCSFQIGDIQAALNRSSLVDRSALVGLDIDELMVAAWMDLRMASIDARFGDERLLSLELESKVASYHESQRRLLQALEEVEDA